MIKKIYNLTTNELMKLFVKPSIIIIILLIFLSAALVPFIPKFFATHMSGISAGSFNLQITGIDAQIKELNAKKPSDVVKTSFLKSQKDQIQLLKDSNAQFGGWKFSEGTNYLNLSYQIDVINLLKENINASTIQANLPYGINSASIKEYLVLPKSEYNTTIEKLTKEKTKIYNDIKGNNYIGYLNTQIKDNTTQLKAAQKELATLNTKAKKEPDNINLKAQISKVSSIIDSLKEVYKVYQYRIDNKVPFDSNNWKSATLTSIENAIPQSQEKMMTRTDFISAPHPHTNYEQYVAKFTHTKTQINNQIKVSWYSLKHNIPQASNVSATKGSRIVNNSLVNIYGIVAILFTMIIASGIVAIEFSKETIKLLLIRPVSRFKVLLSKLLAVYIIGYIVLIGSTIILTISNGIFFSFSDYSAAVLKVNSAGVVEAHNYFGILTTNMFYISLSLLLFGVFAFMLSTITKSTAVSVATSIIIFIAGPILTLVLFGKGLIWLDKTPLPYLNLPSVGMIRDFTSSNAILSNSLGGIEIVILAIILAIIGFFIFIKSDVNK